MALTSRRIIRAPVITDNVGQLGGHLKRGIDHPRGKRTGRQMGLVSALPFADDDDRMVLTFMDRSDPVETFDYMPNEGDNAVLVVPKADVHLSIVKGVCPNDWRGMKVQLGAPMEEPMDLDIDPTGLDVAASDKWVDLVDEIGCDCSKVGGYPLWQAAPVDMDEVVGRPQRFHHRLTEDLIDFGLGGGVIYVFVDPDGSGGSLCWQKVGGGQETTYHHYQ